MGNCMIKFARDEWIPVLSLLSVQVGLAIMSFINKFTVNEGFNPFILTAYRQLGAFFLVFVFALLFERKTAHGMNINIFIQHVMCSLLGGTLNYALFSQGLKFSTPTIASGISNLLPALSFIAAVLFRTEEIQFKSTSGCLKLGGTVLSIVGSMLASFFNGFLVPIPNSSIDWTFLSRSRTIQHISAIGPILIAISCLSKFAYLLLQKRLSRNFPFPYTTTTIICFLSSLQCAIVGLVMERTVRAWSLRSTLRIVAVIYSGVIGSVITLLVMNFFITRKGLVFVSVFNPVALIFIQILGWTFFQENIYFGSLLGSALLMVGLVLVLCANWKEDCLRCSNTVDLEANIEQGDNTVDLEAGIEQGHNTVDSEAGIEQSDNTVDSEADNQQSDDTVDSEADNQLSDDTVDSEAGIEQSDNTVDSEAGIEQSGNTVDSEAGIE